MGWLNPSPDDDYRINAMAQGGNVTTELPLAQGFDGTLTALQKGFATGVDKLNTLGNDVFNPVDKWMDLNTPYLRASPENQLVSEANVKAVQQWAATGQDPRQTGAIGRMAASTSEGLTIVAGSAPALGPWGAAALYGAAEGDSGYHQARAAGLDPTTSAEMAGVTGVTSAAGALLPIPGKTVLSKIATSMAGNVGLDIAGRASTAGVLSANGYQAQADQQKIFDAQSMTADAIMGLAFGVHSHLTRGPEAIKPQDVNPADVDTSAAVLNQSHFERSAPGIPTSPAVATLHADTMGDAINAMTRGDEPNITEPAARELLAGSVPDPAHDMAPHILEAAREEIPQFNDAVDPVKSVEPPAREPLAPLEPLNKPVDAEGNPKLDENGKPPPADDLTQQLNPIVQSHGDMQVTRDDGTVTTVRQLATEMQTQAAESDRMSEAYEAAASCFSRTGGAL